MGSQVALSPWKGHLSMQLCKKLETLPQVSRVQCGRMPQDFASGRRVGGAGPSWRTLPVCGVQLMTCCREGAAVGTSSSCHHPVDCGQGKRQRCATICRAGTGATRRANIKVVVVGVGSAMGKAVVGAVQAARGMEVVGAVDKQCAGEDIGELAGLEALELPVLNDIVMVLSSVAQARDDIGVVVNVGGGSSVYETVRQATAFGLRSVVGAQDLSPKQLTTLIEFCEKSSMGCVAAPSFSIAEVLLQQAAVNAGFYYGEVDITETLDPAQQEAPSMSAMRTAEALKGLGREFNLGAEGLPAAPSEDLLQRTDAGEGLVIHSRARGSADLQYCQQVCFKGPGESLEIKHTVHTVDGYVPGVLLAIRKVVRLTSMVYGLEKIL